MSLPNVYNNSLVEWSKGFTQDNESQTNNLSIKCSAGFTQDYEDQTNNNLLTEWTTDFTQNLSNINLPNIYKDQTNHNLSMEWTVCFTQNQTSNTGITQYREKQINPLQQQYNAKSVKEKEHTTTLVSKHKKKQGFEKCKKCNRKKIPYNKNSNHCRDCYEASLRVLSGNKLIDDFIELTQTSYGSLTRKSKLEFIPYEQFTNIEYFAEGGFSVIYKAIWVDGPITRWCHKKQRYNRRENYDVVLKCLNNSEKMDSNCLNELKNFFNCKNYGYPANFISTIHQYHGIAQDPKTKNYIMIIKFAQNRDLHYFLNKANALSWLEKLNLLRTIAVGLNVLHLQLIDKAEKGEIKFPESIDASASANKINKQATYSSRLLNPLISHALTIQS
ncbi:20696_t:CDS:2, partial [Gigaspora margarita]